ncbi:MAG: DNA gyrase inhibitor YacG [Acidobacteriota bacterium]|mgnify:CR=1 FL=1|nr:DNA gyrase inhibitor YacG [Acidobacteriota bacterium]
MKAPRRCAHCRTRSVMDEWRPFCSERCKLLDLSNWVDEKYRIPDENTDTRLVTETPITDTADKTDPI